MNNFWLDGIMGVAVGDALGLPFQFKTRKELELCPVTTMIPCDLYDSPIGTWSDDTAMTIAIFKSLQKMNCIDLDDIMNNFVNWLYNDEFTANNECIDEGNTCWYGINQYKNGKDVYSCGKTGEHANGNGSLMRTLPVCIYYTILINKNLSTIDEAIDNIHKVSALTHNHIRACIACGLYFFCVKSIISEDGTLKQRLQKGITDGLKYYKTKNETMNEIDRYTRLFNLEDFSKYDSDKINSSGYVVDSFEAAIWSLVTTNSYKDSVLKAVNLGDDTDTIAAIAGGLAGLYYGYNNIPKEWTSTLRRSNWIESICKKGISRGYEMDQKVYRMRYKNKWMELKKNFGNYSYRLHDNKDEVEPLPEYAIKGYCKAISEDSGIRLEDIEIIEDN